MITPPSLCSACKHKNPSLGGAGDGPTCDAYPEGIPGQYWGGGAVHLDPDGRDGGIVFESRGDELSVRQIEIFASFWDEPLEEPEDGGETPEFPELRDRQ